MSSEATAGQIPDVYGQVHPVETPELLAAKRLEMEVELEQIPPEEKQAWMQALAKCDESLVGDEAKLKFLRCEVFNADVSSRTVLVLQNYSTTVLTVGEGWTTSLLVVHVLLVPGTRHCIWHYSIP